MKNKRRIKYIGTPIQKKILFLVFFAGFLPVVIVSAGLYYLIFNLLAYQMVIPEIIINNLIPVLQKVNIVLLIAMPLVFFVIWLSALELSHRIAGPLYRMEKELDGIIEGIKHGPIILRRKDELQVLAKKINKVIEIAGKRQEIV